MTPDNKIMDYVVGLEKNLLKVKEENEKLKQALREFANDENWMFESTYIDKKTRSGSTDCVFVGRSDPRVFAEYALRGEFLENTKSGEQIGVSPFYKPDEKITNLYFEKEQLKSKLKIAVSVLKIIAEGKGQSAWTDQGLCEQALLEIGKNSGSS